MTGSGYTELKDRAVAEMRVRVDRDGSVRSDGNLDSIVSFVDAYARSKARHGIFDAQQYALWRLFKSLVPASTDSGWDAVRARVTRSLEVAGCWQRLGGERGQQWTLHHRWGTDPAVPTDAVAARCLLLDEDGSCADGMSDPRFCARCSRA